MQGNADLYRYSISAQSSEAITAVSAQGKMKYANENIYIMDVEQIEVLSSTDTADIAYLPKSTISPAGSYKMSGFSASSTVAIAGPASFFSGHQGSLYTRELDFKRYELKDLPKAFGMGNVRVVISDVKEPTDANFNQFTADLQSYYNYYPFGMLQPGRKYNDDGYNFGFGGQMRDDEISGEGNSYTAEFWQYDSRLGRRWNRDPVVKPFESSYATYSDNPIFFIDPSGANAVKPDEWEYNVETGTRTWKGNKGGIETQYVNFVNNDRTIDENIEFNGNDFYVSNSYYYNDPKIGYGWGATLSIFNRENMSTYTLTDNNYYPEYFSNNSTTSPQTPKPIIHNGNKQSLEYVSYANNTLSTITTGFEYSCVINGYLRGKNGKMYHMSHQPNQWTGPKKPKLKLAKGFRRIGWGMYGIGIGISVVEGYIAYNNNDYNGVLKSGLDVGMATFATFGGPPGWIIGGGYFMMDMLGGFDNPESIQIPYLAPDDPIQDNTYVPPYNPKKL